MLHRNDRKSKSKQTILQSWFNPKTRGFNPKDNLGKSAILPDVKHKRRTKRHPLWISSFNAQLHKLLHEQESAHRRVNLCLTPVRKPWTSFWPCLLPLACLTQPPNPKFPTPLFAGNPLHRSHALNIQLASLSSQVRLYLHPARWVGQRDPFKSNVKWAASTEVCDRLGLSE